MGLTRFELVTLRLSSVCSNQLSYRPGFSSKNHGDETPAGSLKTRQCALAFDNPESQIDLRVCLGADAPRRDTLERR